MHATRREALSYCLTFKSLLWTFSSLIAAIGYYAPLFDSRLVGMTTSSLVQLGFIIVCVWFCSSSMIITLDATPLARRNKLAIIGCLFLGFAAALVRCVLTRQERFVVQYCVANVCASSYDMARTGYLQTCLASLGALCTMYRTGCGFLGGAYTLKQATLDCSPERVDEKE
eukprot:TRINITY_DN1781_c0_g1_i10.p1 TRINITY_DN1781_c0_g1~~TRINITY_DN1781_c0_g1_i10.p1  ORF type:complete len:171 (+),score=5.69 TRINITY_DN1781_c0_g1_i10:460-972(+)